MNPARIIVNASVDVDGASRFHGRGGLPDGLEGILLAAGEDVVAVVDRNPVVRSIVFGQRHGNPQITALVRRLTRAGLRLRLCPVSGLGF